MDNLARHLEAYPEPGAKKCSKCDETKPLSEFYKDSRRPGRVRAACKVCQSQERMEPENYERVLARQKAAYYRRPVAERQEVNRRARLKDVYGLTLAEYDALLELQGNGCAICGKTPEENGQRLAVDHDHETGEVRGLLCRACNSGIGFLCDNPNLCYRAAQYLSGG